MVAGLPGTGLGGCFFLLSALLMPVMELGRTLRGRSNAKRWRFVLFQSGIAGGVLLTMWVTGWIIGLTLFAGRRMGLSPAAAAALQPHNFLQAPPVFFTMAVLLTVLLSVAILGRVCSRQTAPISR